MEKNTFVSINHLSNKTFIVEDYQRGYKWGKLEIVQLLDDLQKHNESKGPYCLQPIIVKPLDNERYEVIDGQQRLTSLFLLMQYFADAESTIKYNIEYKTREYSKEFLLESDNFRKILESNDWDSFIASNTKNNNIDIYHFYEAYKSIDKWFKSINRQDFLQKIKDCLYIIWYDVTKGHLLNAENISAEKTFINFNANKVDLSGSELIKALFILDYEGTLTKEQKKHNAIELALEWDAIENKLQDDTFWYFICNNDKYNSSATRIDFLLDIVCGEVENKDKLAAYRIYERKINNESKKQEEWRKIKTTFYKLDEWYSDNKMYHYIGYLTATQLAKITDIIKESDEKNKTEFESFLTGKIDTELKKEREGVAVYILDNLNYDDPKTKKECARLLLLLNVMRYIKDKSQNKFPFNLYHLQEWSLEHINPQNPQDFEDIEQFKNWLLSIEPFFEKVEEKQQVELVKKEVNNANKDFKTFLKINAIEEFLKKAESLLETHSISNLALLDRVTNSVLSNRPYLEKRAIILNLDRKGIDAEGNNVYIPICTRDLFTKTYSYLNNKDVGMYFTTKDMVDYKKYIIDELADFLPTQPTKNVNV